MKFNSVFDQHNSLMEEFSTSKASFWVTIYLLLHLIFVLISLILSFFVFIIIYAIIVIAYLVINLLKPYVDVYTEAVVISIYIKQKIWLKFTAQKYSTNRSCLFNYNSPLQFRNKTVHNELVYIMYAYRSSVWNSVFLLHPDCTYLTRTPENIINAGYWVLFEN